LHRPPCFLLNDNGSALNGVSVADILHPQPDQITASELTVYC